MLSDTFELASWSRAEGLESLTAHQSVTSCASRECDSSRIDGDWTYSQTLTACVYHQAHMRPPSCLGVQPVIRTSHRFILFWWLSGSEGASWPPRGGAPYTKTAVFHCSLLNHPRDVLSKGTFPQAYEGNGMTTSRSASPSRSIASRCPRFNRDLLGGGRSLSG